MVTILPRRRHLPIALISAGALLLLIFARLSLLSSSSSSSLASSHGSAGGDDDVSPSLDLGPAHPLSPGPLRLLPENDERLLLLIAWPGSGGSWVRRLVELGTKCATGADGQPINDSRAILVESVDPCPSCKTAYFNFIRLFDMTPLSAVCSFCGVIDFFKDPSNPFLGKPAIDILLLRNPFHALMEAYFSNPGYTSKENGRDASNFDHFRTYFQPELLKWVAHAQAYSRSTLLTLYFERIMRSTRTELIGLFVLLKRHRSDALQGFDPVKAADRTMATLAVMHAGDELPLGVLVPKRHFFRRRIGNETLASWACRQIGPLWMENEWGGKCAELVF